MSKLILLYCIIGMSALIFLYAYMILNISEVSLDGWIILAVITIVILGNLIDLFLKSKLYLKIRLWLDI